MTFTVPQINLKSKIQHQLTHSPLRSKNGYIDFSSIQNKIAMVSRDREKDDASNTVNPQLFLMNVDGSERAQLLYNPFINVLPKWSFDGEWISFLQIETISENADTNLWIVKKDGSGEKKLDTSKMLGITPHCWRKNKAEIMYTTNEKGLDRIHILNVNDGYHQVISRKGWNFSEPSN